MLDNKTGIFYPTEDAVKAIMEIINEGAKKYEANGWKNGVKFDPKSNAASMMRHAMSDSLGILTDPESGHLHLEHLVCRAAMALYARKRGLAGFDRDKSTVNIFDEQNI